MAKTTLVNMLKLVGAVVVIASQIPVECHVCFIYILIDDLFAFCTSKLLFITYNAQIYIFVEHIE